jgi:hypothetical protein
VRGQAVRVSEVRAITTANFPTKTVHPDNSRLDVAPREVFGLTQRQQALGRELDIGGRFRISEKMTEF